jgi:integral membrane protein
LFDSSLKRFRIISFVEGISYLALLFIAMPIKYLGDNPILVKIVGMTHGVLFMLFVYLLYVVARKHKWDKKFVFFAFITSLLPFGMFFLDRDLKKKELDSASSELV